MNLRNQKEINYNVFVQDGNDIPGDKEIVLLHICDENENGFECEECEFNKINVEYMFLRDTLGWKEGITEHKYMAQGMDIITKLAEYLFLTEQMN